jgi:DNA-binding response OmpR family regulator
MDSRLATVLVVSDAHASQETPARSPRVLVYSDDRTVRHAVLLALGRRPAADFAPVEYIECATEPAVIAAVDAGGIDLLILDGEAAPAGGMGIARQVKDEIFHCPPVLVLIARPQDAWLATWSRADAVAARPVNPMVLATTVSTLLRQRMASVS